MLIGTAFLNFRGKLHIVDDFKTLCGKRGRYYGDSWGNATDRWGDKLKKFNGLAYHCKGCSRSLKKLIVSDKELI